MEVNKQVKSGEVLDKCIDMSKVKLDALKAQINRKICDIFKIEEFVYNELKLEQFISPLKMHIHMTEFLNGPLVRQFIFELWPILLAAEESATVIPTDPIEPTKNEILKKGFQTHLRKGCERSQSSSNPRSRKQGNMVTGGEEPPLPPTTFGSTLKPQGRIDIEKDIKHHEKHRSTNSRNSSRVISTKPEQKQPLVPSTTFGSTLKPQQRINMVNGGTQTLSSTLKPLGRIDISKVKLDVLKPWIIKKITNILQREDNAAVEFLYNKLKQDKMLCPQKLQIRIAGYLNGGKAQKFVYELWPLLLSAQESESGIPAEFMQQKKDENVRIEKDIKHSEKHDGSTSSRSTAKNIENQTTTTSERGNDDGAGVVTCGLGGFANTCMYSPQQSHQETKAVSQDRHPSTPVRQFLSQHCAEMDEFLNHWNETPEKQTVLLSEKFIYPGEKNIEKQINTTLLPPSSVGQSDQKQQKRFTNLKELVKAEDEIKAARQPQSRKRKHSTMINESNKSKNISSDKDVLQPDEKQQTKAKKSSSKRSSGKDSATKPGAKSSEKKIHNKYSNAMKKHMLELFGSCSSDEEERRPDEDSSRKPVAEPKEKEDHKKSNNEMQKLEFDVFGQPSARNSEAVKKGHNREMSTLEADLFISSDEEDV